MIRIVSQPGYNYRFNTENGAFARWGNTQEEDPKYSPVGPEIADIEISTICHGPFDAPCKFCYKSNTYKGENMSLETFKNIFSKIRGNLTQIAFGIGDVDSNPDMMDIFQYCRDNGVVPNVTVNGEIDWFWSRQLASVCGAVAVSRYGNGEKCYHAVRELLKAGLKQVNIHQLLCEETIGSCWKTVQDIGQARDAQVMLGRLKAVVFLTVKPKGRAKQSDFHPVSLDKLRDLVDLAEDRGVQIGFDSCTAPKLLCAVREHKNFSMFETCVEPCESTLFSVYINVKGEVYPCSFTEGEPGWEKGISVLECDDFLDEIWYHERVRKFRAGLLETEGLDVRNCFSPCRKCPAYMQEIY